MKLANNLKGLDKHLRRLKKLNGPGLLEAVVRGLYAGGNAIEIEAEISITNGSISGKGHVPSAPGEPPNADTRLLDTSIHTYVMGPNPPRVEVVSEAPYSAALEFGTSKMDERPFMRPATAKKRDEVTRAVMHSVKAFIRQSDAS